MRLCALLLCVHGCRGAPVLLLYTVLKLGALSAAALPALLAIAARGAAAAACVPGVPRTAALPAVQRGHGSIRKSAKYTKVLIRTPNVRHKPREGAMSSWLASRGCGCCDSPLVIKTCYLKLRKITFHVRVSQMKAPEQPVGLCLWMGWKLPRAQLAQPQLAPGLAQGGR